MSRECPEHRGNRENGKSIEGAEMRSGVSRASREGVECRTARALRCGEDIESIKSIRSIENNVETMVEKGKQHGK